jgi:hypothetical protein
VVAIAKWFLSNGMIHPDLGPARGLAEKAPQMKWSALLGTLSSEVSFIMSLT